MSTSRGPEPEPEQEQEPEERQPARRPIPRTGDFMGKHRLTAAIHRLEEEIKCLQAELDEFEMMEPASTACKDVCSSTEGKPDALLPVTPGPENAAWERWFESVRSSRSRSKWWTSKGSFSIA